jgi:hypothetical protein
VGETREYEEFQGVNNMAADILRLAQIERSQVGE